MSDFQREQSHVQRGRTEAFEIRGAHAPQNKVYLWVTPQHRRFHVVSPGVWGRSPSSQRGTVWRFFGQSSPASKGRIVQIEAERALPLRPTRFSREHAQEWSLLSSSTVRSGGSSRCWTLSATETDPNFLEMETQPCGQTKATRSSRFNTSNQI